MKNEMILVTGALGQLGTELTRALRLKYGNNSVLATDIRMPQSDSSEGPFELLDVLDGNQLNVLLEKYKITQVYHLAAILSAAGEKAPLKTWEINMNSLLLMLQACVDNQIGKMYWPSSIAVFSKETPKEMTPQDTHAYPSTVYGISKLSGEYWCKYYFERYGLDVRSLRYPGLISYETLPGGGTTDYAVDIYFKAVKGETYECFLSENTYLPMMYMPDAVRATLELMEAPSENIKVRTSYNLSAMSFSPKEITKEIQAIYPEFKVSYKPDSRQNIADGWPDSIDDSSAAKDWSWKPAYDLKGMTEDMCKNLRKRLLSESI